MVALTMVTSFMLFLQGTNMSACILGSAGRDGCVFASTFWNRERKGENRIVVNKDMICNERCFSVISARTPRSKYFHGLSKRRSPN